ncbi:MAG: NAD(P)-dependent oxidoreductase [Bacteroidetes bacterium]|nr:NAD(P)-dependent oxidoreductase [Bacteroidota bacterium]
MTQILVTGSRGFVGKALVTKLADIGYQVIGIDQEDGDISDKQTLSGLGAKGIDYIFHLAGKTFVPESWKNPFEFYKVNILGAVNVLDLCRESGCGLTFISSYVYGNPSYFPIDEQHPVQVFNPYNHSKILGEEICKFYMENFHIQGTIIRPFNIYGPGQPSHFLIPEIISKVISKEYNRIEMMDLRPKRDFLYIDDFTDALILSMKKPKGIYNLGSGYSVSVEEIIRMVLEITSIRKEYCSLKNERQNEIFDLYADISKITATFNWTPSTTLTEGLGKCIHSFMNPAN